jgi:hypothetical protein
MKNLHLYSLAVITVACAPLSWAQTGSLNGPVAGYVYDSAAQALRPVLGIAGAATLGAPVSGGYSFTAATVSPRLDSFFGVASGGSTHWFAISGGSFNETAIAGLMASPERIVFSPSGTAAALYAGGQAQIVTGLPGAPAVAGTVGLNQTSSPRARRIPAPALAISDDGAYLLAALNGSIQLASQSGVVRPVIQTGADPVVAFAPGGHDAAIAARGTGALIIRDAPGSAIQQPLATDGAAFSATAGIAFSADGSHVYYASASAQTVSVFDLSGNRSDLPCSFSPAELSAMGTVFRLNELGQGPLWLADAAGSGPRVVFVPALSAAQ